ncbi:uncharacterized protein ColSpa_03454 [Colletotrichum spaethianum]|uniref:Uncharacterized protein n=1 Tax=Colletotrichum spaethianum TaxID=700344 RepID=A0AA37L7G9_9PEZI|nr:uncharacterized protein ColSpa_03454 [Colletotrichum spaethianum]GKT43273.1 hypothetical protein ColSpa_03454 [Colletotrichum spaethianum]
MALAAEGDIWNISGTCSADLTCEIDTQYASPEVACGNMNGKFAGSGTNGRTSCTPVNTKCTYTWQC